MVFDIFKDLVIKLDEDLGFSISLVDYFFNSKNYPLAINLYSPIEEDIQECIFSL